MPLIGGKNAKKKSSSSTTKRHFTVVIGNKEHGLYVSSSPSSAARKAVSKLCATDKKKKVEFQIREITQGSKKKTYGPYVGKMKKLDKPIELKGRVIKYSTDVYLDKIIKKSFVKKGGAPIVAFDFTINKNKLMLYINEKYKNELRQENIQNGFTNITLVSFGFILIQKISRRLKIFYYPNRSERIAIYACYVDDEIKCYAIARCASLYECEDRKHQSNYENSIKRRISRPCTYMEPKILFLFREKSNIQIISSELYDRSREFIHKRHHIHLRAFKSFIYKGEITFKSFISSEGDEYCISIEIMNNDFSLFNFLSKLAYDVINIESDIKNNLILPNITKKRTYSAVHPPNNNSNNNNIH